MIQITGNKQYHAALQLLKQYPKITPIISVPCFEYWLLLHYEEQTHIIHRDKALQDVKKHIAGYEKGNKDVYKQTKDKYEEAALTAYSMRKRGNSYETGTEAFANVDHLVDLLINKKPRLLSLRGI